MPALGRPLTNRPQVNNLPYGHVWEFPIPGGLVLAVPDVDGLFLLNPSAGLIWAELRLGSDADAIARRLVETFGIDSARARVDVDETLRQWAETFKIKNRQAEAPIAHLAPGGHLGPVVTRLNGVRLRIELGSAEMAAEILPRVAHLVTGDGYADFTLRATPGETVSGARALLLQEMVRLAHGNAEWLALLHAGACSKGRACAIFAGASNSGKSTLAAVLMARGFGFHGDDSVGVMRGSRLVPAMPFGLAIREGSWGVVGARMAGFEGLAVHERFGQRVRFVVPEGVSDPLRAVALVFPRYVGGAAFSVTELDPLEALVELKESGFWVAQARENIGEFLDWVAGLRRVRLVYGDVEDAVRLMGQVLSHG